MSSTLFHIFLQTSMSMIIFFVFLDLMKIIHEILSICNEHVLALKCILNILSTIPCRYFSSFYYFIKTIRCVIYITEIIVTVLYQCKHNLRLLLPPINIASVSFGQDKVYKIADSSNRLFY